MTPCSYGELFEALATVGIRTVLREYFNDNSCINTTRVLLEIFRHFGMQGSIPRQNITQSQGGGLDMQLRVETLAPIQIARPLQA